ncbi:MAG: hypothetical protein IKW90_10540 [Lachnospiraceae bacterium]|nr:hypothetical protein [Lachnospiraceae bacterium]
MKKTFKEIVKKIMVTAFVICLAFPVVLVSAKSNNSTKQNEIDIFPQRDTELDHYKYVTGVPEIIFSTTAKENGLQNTCYCLEGKVVGVYKSGAKAMKAIGKKDAAKQVSDTPDMKTIILETQFGQVMITDMYSYLVTTYKMFLDDASIKELKKEYTYFSTYKDYPKKGSYVKILAVYSGYSDVADMPAFMYGINKMIIGSDAENKNDSVKQETKSYTYDKIKIEIPVSLGNAYVDGDTHFFYPQNNSMLFITKFNLDGFTLNQMVADELESSLASSAEDYKLTASKSYQYKDKAIKNYYVYAFTSKINGEKCKCRLTVFEYNGVAYLICMRNSKNNKNNEELFELYTNIIKSVKPKK